MRNKPHRNGKRLIEFVRDGVVIFLSWLGLYILIFIIFRGGFQGSLLFYGIWGAKFSEIFRKTGKFWLWFGIRYFLLCERTVRSRVTLRKEGQVDLWGDA